MAVYQYPSRESTPTAGMFCLRIVLLLLPLALCAKRPPNIVFFLADDLWNLGYYTEDVTPSRRGFDSFYGFYNGEEDYYTHTITYVRSNKPFAMSIYTAWIILQEESARSVYLRMPPSVFDTLLGLVRPLIERQVTPFRDPISAHDRLAMTIRFTYADIGHYGGEGDSGIFQRSPLLEVLEKGLLGIPQPRSIGSIGLIPYHMVGDEAFPLKPFMMRPYPRRELQKFRNDPAQRQEYLKRATFNYRLSRARRLIENAFGIMSSRWRILRRPFRASEETTQNIVKSCVVLHNFLLSSPQSRSAYSPPGFTDHEDWEGNIVEGSWRAGSDSLPGMGDLTTMSGYHSAR
ncbi:hypothetical protein V5799_027239 [Amblyomma americanum]|uniref:DDE Tnp4 domain-containing protein n=1 Tax=Amblyomma americanum TaxID=6943 RepID=A0AAQ4DGA1_AMBAM